MNASARPLSIAMVIACLPLGACRKHAQEKDVSEFKATSMETDTSTDQASAHDKHAPSLETSYPQQEIADLKREMELREQAIGDLEAAVVMERAKLVENPDYDQSFLNEVLHEQEQVRKEIERARKRIEALSGSGD